MSRLLPLEPAKLTPDKGNMKPDLSTINLFTALEQLCRREFSALELTEAFLRQIERLNPTINAFITLTPELARQGALQADALLTVQSSNLEQFTLLGMPVALKDLFETAGIRTTAGSKFFADHIPAEDAHVVLKIKLSGGVVLGKTNTHEIALGVTGVNPHYGAVKNPWDLTRVTGGSSSGSAAAVATGMCLAALGTDTGGSIRIPASLCGVVGLKPTYGRVSTRGVVPLSWNLDHVGPLTRTARDAAMMLAAMAGFDPHDPASVDIPVEDYLVHLEDGVRGWRVALAAGEYVEASDPQVLAGVAEAAQVFKDLGAQVEKVDMSWLADLALANGRMTQADGAAFHRERLAERPDWFGADVRQRLETGAALTSSEYALARRTQAEGRRRFEMFFEKFDILLLPTTPIPAPPIEGTQAIEAARQLTRFTAPFNLAGLPALSVPCGLTGEKLPIGLQIISKHWGEAKALQAAHAFEQATEWHNYHPNIFK
ncbi:MAG: amidase [Syntrophaceae bacterium]|nr:amidase [Syntrophaceae bacterium]